MRKNIILTISHDIRAPLNVISGSAELAVDTREKKRRNTHLNNIRIVCRHVVHLLNNLLDVYRLNEAKETRNDVPFNLNALLERIAFGFSHVINNKGILFNHDLPVPMSSFAVTWTVSNRFWTTCLAMPSNLQKPAQSA